MRKVEKQRLDAWLFDKAQSRYSEIAESVAADQLRVEHQHPNRRMGITKAQYIDATMDFMEKTGVFNTQYELEKRFDAAANVLEDDGFKAVCRLKQTFTPKGAAQRYLTTVTDVMILNHAVGLDVVRGTQSNTQGVWPWKLPIDNLPHKYSPSLESSELMFDLSKQFCRNFPSTAAG